MKKILIGLTPSHNTETDDIYMRSTYLKALSAAGAIPIILPLDISREETERFMELLDGFLFTGGPDPHPFLFGQETYDFCGEVSLKRDTMELTLLSLAIKRQKPILGICRGIQIINVGLGGTIYQDINRQHPRQLPIAHKQPFPYSIPSHSIQIVPGTRLARICGSPVIRVNSMHHQAVKDLAPGLIASGVSPDGLTEAIELPAYPFLVAVQWHPEHLWHQDAAAAALFRHFVLACSGIHNSDPSAP